MKYICHCGDTLGTTFDFGYTKGCPSQDSALVIRDNQIVGYKIQIGAYKVETYSNLNITTLYKHIGYGYYCIFAIDYKLELPIHNNQLQSKQIIDRMQKLKVFS